MSPSLPASGRRLAVAALALSLTAALAGCGDRSEPAVQTLPPRTSSTTTPDPHGGGSALPGTATITTFEVKNQISCSGTVPIATQATYATEGATSVAFVVDGEQVAGTLPPSGAFDLPLLCDGRSHTVVLVAVDASGATTVDSRGRPHQHHPPRQLIGRFAVADPALVDGLPPPDHPTAMTVPSARDADSGIDPVGTDLVRIQHGRATFVGPRDASVHAGSLARPAIDDPVRTGHPHVELGAVDPLEVGADDVTRPFRHDVVAGAGAEVDDRDPRVPGLPRGLERQASTVGTDPERQPARVPREVLDGAAGDRHPPHRGLVHLCGAEVLREVHPPPDLDDVPLERVGVASRDVVEHATLGSDDDAAQRPPRRAVGVDDAGLVGTGRRRAAGQERLLERLGRRVGRREQHTGAGVGGGVRRARLGKRTSERLRRGRRRRGRGGARPTDRDVDDVGTGARPGSERAERDQHADGSDAGDGGVAFSGAPDGDPGRRWSGTTEPTGRVDRHRRGGAPRPARRGRRGAMVRSWFLHSGSQRGEGTVQVPLDRALGAAEHGRRLRGAQALEVAQGDGLALAAGQGADRIDDGTVPIAVGGGLVRSGCGRVVHPEHDDGPTAVAALGEPAAQAKF